MTGTSNGAQQSDNAPKPVKPIPVPSVVKDDPKPRGESRNGSER